MRDDAVAVIGLACRLPGAASPDDLWDLLCAGAATPGRSGFLEGTDRFDAAFFGISARAARVMDPRQRLVLELGWEVLEQAGIVPEVLRGTDTGVYLGSMWDDYATLVHEHGVDVVDAHAMTGLHRNFLANRLSYVLGLRGPSLVVDTGQSSSLVAVHLACESLRSGTSAMAVAGGVNLLLDRTSDLVSERFGALSPDGRCYTFDARANGYVRGEGGGLVLLKPLAAALADGDHVWSVIRGGAVNNDGGGASLTAPDPVAQEELLRAAYRAVGVDPAEVQYVELHGTGTPVGDPVEAAALGAVLGRNRVPGADLRVGSIKTNIGHLEGAAGIAGLLKTVLSLRHGRLPASLNYEHPNPAIPLESLGLRVQQDLTPWPEPGRSLVAGVSSFGLGGTNCHLVLSGPPETGRTDSGADPALSHRSRVARVVPWTLSAKTPGALRAQAVALRAHLDAYPELDPVDLGYSLATVRTAFRHRATGAVRGREELAGALDAVAAGLPWHRVEVGETGPHGGVTFVFPGQGGQWPGMAAGLMNTSAVFAGRIAECVDAFAPHVGSGALEPLRDLLAGVPVRIRQDRSDIVQPALFAMMVSLAAVWQDWGVTPEAVVGHSQGEIAAACVAGALSLRDAAWVIAVRSRILTDLAGRGGMASVALPVADLELDRWGSRLSVAALNGPNSTVVSGESEALDELLAWCAAEGVRSSRIAVDYASHSPQMASAREQILDELSAIRPMAARTGFLSTVTGRWMDGSELDASYWYDNLRQPVRFDPAVRSLAEAGHRTFVEVSPHPTLTHGIDETLADHGCDDAVSVGSLRRDDGGLERLMGSLAAVQVRGVEPDWHAVFTPLGGRRVPLPTYAFQRERYWVADDQDEPHGAPDSGAGRTMLDVVRGHAAATLGNPVADDRTPFRELGFDSHLTVELRNRLVADTGLALTTTVLFEHPTPVELAAHLDRLSAGAPETSIVDRAQQVRDDHVPQDEVVVGVVGMGCRLPGGIDTPEKLWDVLVSGKDVMGPFPTDRGWVLPDGLPERGGFLDDAAGFDAAFFGISPREALTMDPQQRHLLETTWHALEHAGIDPATLRGTNTGVFIGATAQDYGPRMAHATPTTQGHLLTGTSLSLTAGRIAYTLGLHGPTLTVDTACSASLTAIHLAVRALRAGDCDLAIVGGAHIMATPGMFIEFTRQGGLAPDGYAKPFSADADGTAWSEGIGVLVLQPLTHAHRHHRPVLATIPGTATNHDGPSNGLTAPNPNAQQDLIHHALADARLTPHDIDTIETHGTGTTLGDPIEAHALHNTYAPHRTRPLHVTANKAALGHTQAAAGITSAITTILAINNHRLPPTAHLSDPTPHLDWTATPLTLTTQPAPWTPQPHRLRTAAINSFGISGTNTHIIVRQPPAPPDPARPSSLPRTVFRHRRFWLTPDQSDGGLGSAGLRPAEHPLLGAVIPQPGRSGWTFSARIGPHTQEWLADHVVGATPVFPGAAFVEIVLRAGAQAGADRIDELVLHEPLVLSTTDAVRVSVALDGPDEDGRRAVTVHSQPGLGSPDAPWVLNAAGWLAAEGEVTPPVPAPQWPPADAVAVPITSFHDDLAATGFHYGPSFRGLRQAWRSGGDLCAEVSLDEDLRASSDGYLVHPALLDAAAQLMALRADGPARLPGLPHTWQGVTLHRPVPADCRVRLTWTGADSMSLVVMDDLGTPVLTVASLSVRPAGDLALPSRPAGTYRVSWREWQADVEPVPPSGWAVVGDWLDADGTGPQNLADAIDAGERIPDVVVLLVPPGPPAEQTGTDLPRVVRERVSWVLDTAGAVLSDDRFDATRLAVVTRGAVAVASDVADGEPVDLAVAPVWGLVRTAQREHPGRIVLLDTDTGTGLAGTLSVALAADEEQLAVRAGVFSVPRITRPGGAGETAGAALAGGTVLLTGAGGTLGTLLARHLVTGHGVRELVLVSRSGPDPTLVAELRALGVVVTAAAVDVSDREAMAELVAKHPVTGVVHAAGVLDDAVFAAHTADRLDRVLRPKVDGAWVLHEVTRHLDLTAFVLFSSVAGTFGNAGQAGYAAANVFLDALASHRVLAGLPAVSIAWGLWAERSDMTGELDRTALARLRRSGLSSLSTADGLALFDGAPVRSGHTVVAANLDTTAVTDVPTMLRDLVRPAGTADRRAPRAVASARDPLVLVRATVRAVLGYGAGDRVQDEQSFSSLGFDSLTGVELRNRLQSATGLRLPATLMFDHPTPRALAEHLRAALAGPPSPADGVVVSTRTETDEPIAIVAMSCRYPGGVRSPEDLWELVRNAGDGIGGFPTDRGWPLDELYDPDPDRPGTSYVREGGFLADAAEFDAELFGVSPREALAMDPQHRLLLEVSWEAVERAGIDPSSLRGSATGVFAGLMYHDYADLVRRAVDGVEGYLATGGAGSLASGRVAYALGLEGPAITVDTACSSSLVSVHLAVRSLRTGECSLALAGGVTVMATPGIFVDFSRQRGLAADARCKSFASAADGTGWSEGVGVLVLERLSDAVANGHPILATVRGTAVNQDGASNGVTAPSGPAQERVIRNALADAGLGPSDVDAVEGHGTGTELGDPIEARALLATYGRNRAGEPLWLGSLKSNIGHTQAAAGVAGVIKMVQAMRNGLLPSTRHVDEPSRHVDWASGAVRLLTEAVPWPETGRPRRASVSAFGISGTNAHVVLEHHGAETARPESTRPACPVPLVLAGRTETALRTQAGALAARLGTADDWTPADVGCSLATGRAALDHRAVVLAADRAEVVRGLEALAAGTPSGAVVEGMPSPAGELAFLFPGQGTQWAGMGRRLAEAHPEFDLAFTEVCAEFDGHIGRSLRELVFDPEPSGLLDRTRFTQPALFALEVALFRLMRAWGLVPGLLLGHSVGELAAAHVAGVMSLPDACALVAARARLMDDLPAGGAMVALHATEEEVLPLLSDGVSLAAINGPEDLVVSGDEDAVEWIAACFPESRRLRVSHAFHSAHMDPMLADFGALAATMSFSPATIPVVSNVTGRVATDADLCSADYWVRQVRSPVRFHDGVDTARERGVTAFLELGSGALAGMMRQGTGPEERSVLTVSALRRERDEAATVVDAVARLHVAGVALDWLAFFAPFDPVRVDLPTYAFQRTRYWADPVAVAGTGGEDPAAARFWAAVDRGDHDALNAELGTEVAASISAALPALASWRQRTRDRSRVDTLRHRAVWRPHSGGAATTPATPGGPWLIVGPDGPGTVAATTALAGRGIEVRTVGIHPADADRKTLTTVLDGVDVPVVAVLSLLGLDEHHGLTATLALLQALGESTVDAQMWCVTTGAVSVGPGDRLAAPEQAQVWGLGRVAALEQPRRWGGMVDLPGTPADRDWASLAGVLGDPGGEDEVAVRDTGVYVRRLVKAPAAPVASDDVTLDGTVLITGGTGALGAAVARSLAARGTGGLVLAGRRGPDAAGAGELAAELSALGADVAVVACDVSDRADLATLFDSHPITAVVHAAGVLDDGVLDGQTAQRFERVLAPKALAARHLHELTRERDLSAFVLFSSAAGVAGSPGQSNYAAANAFLDALAEQRRADGLPATAVAWGPWADAGMAGGSEVANLVRRQGFTPMATETAIAALWSAVATAEPAVLVADVRWERFADSAVRPRRLLAELVPAPGAGAPGAEERPRPAERLRTVPPAERARLLVELVRSEAAVVLGHADAGAVAAGQAFRDLGFDSLAAVQLRNRLAVATGVEMTPTVVFDHPTPTALAAHLGAELGGDGVVAVLADLDRIEASLAVLVENGADALSGDGADLVAIEERLRKLTHRFTGGPGDPAAAGQLASASDDEVFDFISNELGIS
jgi:acyl transferase domain-containing protein/acyl carrier protein